MDDELTIPDLSDDVISALERLAVEHGCTLEEEACRILKAAVEDTKDES